MARRNQGKIQAKKDINKNQIAKRKKYRKFKIYYVLVRKLISCLIEKGVLSASCLNST